MPFSLSLRDLAINVDADDAVLENTIARQFSAVGLTRATPVAAPVGSITVRRWTDRTGKASDLVEAQVIHGARPAIGGRDLGVLVTKDPIAVTTVKRPCIHVLCCDEVDIHHVHHMIKYPLRFQLEASGAVLIHASGVVTHDKAAVLFLGGRGAGKSSAMVGLVECGTDAIANDSVFILRTAGQITALAWPHVVRLGRETILQSPRLQRWFASHGARRVDPDGKISVYFDALDAAFGRSLTRSPCRCKAVVEIKLDPESRALEVERPSEQESERIVDQHVVGYRFQTGWLPGWEWPEHIEPLREMARLLLRQCRFLQLKVGLKSENPWARVHDVLENL